MPSGSSPRSLALIGFGGSGAGIHAPIISATTSVELTTIVTQDAERAERARRSFPNAAVTQSFHAAADCEVAVVTLPVAYRGDIVERLVSRGVRVVVEKPFAADLAAARTLATIAGDRIAVFHNRRWDSDFLTLQRLQAHDEWSGPVRVTSRIQRWQPAVRDGWRNRPDGGGFLREVATHQIDQMLTLLGPATSVFAEIATRRDGANAEDDVFLAIDHLDRSRSHLISGALGNPRLPRFDLASTRTMISMGAGDPQQEQVQAGIGPAEPQWGMPDASEWWMEREPGIQHPLTPERGWWPGFYEAVATWVDGGPPPVSAEDGLATMALIEAARRSAEIGARVPVGEN